MRKITHLVVHHSLTEDGDTKNWNAIRKYHMETNGWADIGYHYGIEKVRGKITLQYGRKVSRTGAHVAGMNKNTIGICVVGNYDKRAPSAEKLNKLEALVRQLQRTFKVPSKNVIGHWEAQRLQGLPPEQRKSCPGTKFDMAAFRRDRTDA